MQPDLGKPSELERASKDLHLLINITVMTGPSPIAHYKLEQGKGHISFPKFLHHQSPPFKKYLGW